MSSDHFERAKTAILMKDEQNGGPSPRDLLHAMVELTEALARDDDDKHEETAALLGHHITESVHRDTRIASCEQAVKVVAERQIEWEEGCPERKQRATDEHQRFHDGVWKDHLESQHAPRREDDDAGSDYRKERRGGDATDHERTFLMWTLGSKLGAFVIAVLLAAVVTLVNIALNYLWFGHP